MICTVIRNTNGSRELQYGKQHLANSRGIESYTYVDVPEAKVEEIRKAKTEEIQAILKTLY